MNRFEINILGCGSATPTPRHNPAAQVVNFRDNLFMVDCGEGAQKMFRKMGLNFQRINHIFISHMHGDHVLGLPGLLSTLSLHERTGRVTVHLPEEGVEVMQQMVNFFCRESSYEIVLEPITGNGGRVFESDSLTVDAFPLYHRVPCYGFLFKEKPGLRHLRGDMAKFYQIPVYKLAGIKAGEDYVTPEGVVIPNSVLTTDADPVRSYAYCSDTVMDARVAEAVKGVTLLYHEATYDSSLATKARERGHSTSAEAAQIAKMAGAKALLIGHYSKRYTSTDILVNDAREVFENVTAANEGLTIKL